MRKSNFELLRIFAMFGIVLHHLMVNDLDVLGYNTPYVGTSMGGVFPIVNSVSVCGVDLFLLITGWFGINHFLKKIVSLSILCFLIGCICMVVAMVSPVYESSVKNNILTITSLHSWFIKYYFCLLLISPLLEWIIAKVKKRQMLLMLIVLTILNVIGCWCLELIRDNRIGYSVLNFVYIYFLGRLFRLYQDNKCSMVIEKYGFIIAILLAIIAGSVFDYLNNNGQYVESRKYWAYNSPVVLVLSSLIFVFFSKLNINNSRINYIASCCLVVYLLHSNLVMGYYRDAMTDFFTSHIGGLLGLFVSALIVYLLGTIIGFTLIPIQKIILQQLHSFTIGNRFLKT